MSEASTKRTVRYFVSYAHADGKLPAQLEQELQKQLGACKHYHFERWHDHDILVGEKWHDEIQNAVAECDFGLLLVSPSFLGSKYITQHELPHFVDGAKPCVPVALCTIDFDNQDLKGLEVAQIFRFTPPRAAEAKPFSDCTSAKHRSDFVFTLYGQMVARLGKIFASAGPGSVPKPAGATGLDEAAYRAHIRKHYRHLQLEALSGDQLTYRDIDLQQVFIPQDARDCREWLPEALEVPASLTREAADQESNGDNPALKLAELYEHKRFQNTSPRNIFDILGDPSALHRVVLGAPGAGKSSLTRIRLLTWVESSGVVPILIELRRYHRSGRTDVLEYLQNDQDLIFRFDAADLRARLAAGTVELLFDGLDEIFEPLAREKIARQIAGHAGTYKNARILVTSRLIGYPGRILRDAAFGHWLLADFDDQKITEFREHWLKDAIREPGDRPVIRDRLDAALRSPVIRELAGNPLLLTLMAVLARKSDLPRDLASLYARAADLLLEQWDTHRLLAADLELGSVIIDQKDKRDLLRDLAWQMQTGQRGLRGNLISQTAVEAAMDTAFQHRIADAGLRRKAISLLIDQLTERNYILCHVGGAQFAFVHRGFLEFFASEYILNIITQRPDTALVEIGKIYQAHAAEDAWREVLILAATRFEAAVADKILLPLTKNADAQDVGSADCEEIPHPFTLVCSVLSRAREPHKLASTSTHVRSNLEDWLQRDSSYSDADGWVRLLAQCFSDARSRRLLTELARRSHSIFASRQAITSLVEHFLDSETRTLLIELGRREENTSTRLKAVESLAEHYRDAEAHTMLMELALREEDTDARRQAVESLADYYPDAETHTLLMELAHRVEDTNARCQAISSLAEHCRDAETRTLLIELVRSDENTGARYQAVSSLAKHYRDAESRSLLIELACGEENTDARLRAVSSLAEHYRDAETRTLLIELARREKNTGTRRQAVESLTEYYRDGETRSLLIELTRIQEDTGVRSQVVKSLAKHYQDEEIRTLLVELARHEENTEARHQAIASLAEHYRNFPETPQILQDIAATPLGHKVIAQAKTLARTFLSMKFLDELLKK